MAPDPFLSATFFRQFFLDNEANYLGNASAITLREMPKLLDRCLVGAPSWHVVIERLTRARDDWREELDRKERDREYAAREERPTHREAVQSIAAILGRISDAR